MSKKLNQKEQVDKKIAEYKSDTCFICGKKLTEKDEVVEKEHFRLGVIRICKEHGIVN